MVCECDSCLGNGSEAVGAHRYADTKHPHAHGQVHIYTDTWTDRRTHTDAQRHTISSVVCPSNLDMSCMIRSVVSPYAS